MKMKGLFMSSIILGALVSTTVPTFAAEYTDATHAKSDATITFDADNEPANPTDPGDNDQDKEIVPEKPVNPNGAELMITYVSDFDFGTQSKSETTWNALADHLTDGTEIVPFVATKDNRGTDRKGWELTAKIDGDFKDGSGNVLKGAELTLGNMGYNVEHADADMKAELESVKPTATASDVVLNSEGQRVSISNAETGMGRWSMALGALQTDADDASVQTATGVTLTVPSTSIKNTATYSTTVTWELTADPTV